MPLSRRERFRLKSRIVDRLMDGSWSSLDVNLLFGEFGLRLVDNVWEAPEVLAGLSDTALVEMYAVVFDVEESEVEGAVAAVDQGGWKPGYVQLFLSHSAVHREFMAAVADQLAVVGIHGFVAHDAMEISRPWQAQIEQALRSMQAFAAIVHPEFNDSQWCQQEVGWAIGRNVPRFAIRLGADPRAFLGSDQWPSMYGAAPKEVANAIAEWVTSLPELGDAIVDALFNALASAGNYYDAQASAERIAALGTLTEEQFQRLNDVWWSNDQAYGGFLPTKPMRRFYEANGRAWPPPRPVPATPQVVAVNDDEPF